MKLKCTCGSGKFKSGLVKITFKGIPCTLDSEDGPQYNDQMAEYSFGWDWNEYDMVECAACKKKYMMDSDQNGEMVLDPRE